MNDLQNTSHLQSFTLLRNNMPQFTGGGKFNFFSRRGTTNSFMSIITQKGVHHSLIFTFLLLFCCVGNLKAQNEPLCIAPTACNDLKIEMIRMENALASCSPAGCADRFRQVAFKVYLKYTLPSAPSQALVALDYQYLRVKTYLKVIPQIAGSPTYSKLNVDATQTCFKTEHPNWASFSSSNGDKVLLETNGASNEVGIDFFSDPNNTSAYVGTTVVASVVIKLSLILLFPHLLEIVFQALPALQMHHVLPLPTCRYLSWVHALMLSCLRSLLMHFQMSRFG